MRPYYTTEGGERVEEPNPTNHNAPPHHQNPPPLPPTRKGIPGKREGILGKHPFGGPWSQISSLFSLFQGAAWHRKGLAPLVGPLAASFGDLWRPLGVCLLSSLFSLLSPLFSLLSSPCRRGLATPRSHEFHSSFQYHFLSRLLHHPAHRAPVTWDLASAHP